MANDLEPERRAKPLSVAETMRELHGAVGACRDQLDAVQDTLRPSKQPSDTARAMLDLAPALQQLGEALLDYQRWADRKFR